MPIYVLECIVCGHTFDALVRYEDTNPLCERCGNKVKRKISAPYFVLRGEGWYKPSPKDKAE